MLDFMEYVQNAFYEVSRWDRNNSYGSLTATARALLDFETPRGIRLSASSLSSPNSATSYGIGSVGVVDGSISYLYSSLPLRLNPSSSELELQHIVPGYRHLRELSIHSEGLQQRWWSWRGGSQTVKKDALLYGRMFLPRSTLEALYIRRISPVRQLRVSCVSDARLQNGGTILTLLQNDYGRYTTEYLYSTDGGLLGARGLYNFGNGTRIARTTPSNTEDRTDDTSEPMHGRFSAGAEVYYGLLNKSGGMSTGLRFATLPTHTGFPYTMTLTLNPLMGNLSSTYAVKAGRNLSLCSRFDFNFYSYESDLQLGCELWRRHPPNPETEWARKLIRPEWKKPWQDEGESDKVLKARVDQNWKVGVLWEGKVKELLFSLGASFDLKKREQILSTVGVELQYSS